MTPRFPSRFGSLVVGACLCFSLRNAGAAPQEADGANTSEAEQPPGDDAGWDLPSPSDPADSQPPEAEPPEAEPAETEPAEAEPAQGEPAEAEPAQGEPAPPGAPPSPPVEAEAAHPSQAPPAALQPASPGDQRDDDAAFDAPRNQLGISVGVPFYDESIVHGDMTVDVRYGRKFWWLVPTVSAGFRQARLDPGQVPDHARRKKLEAWHATVGVRLEIPTSARLFPFIGVAGELSTWSFTADTADFCQDAFYPDAWRCYRRQDWKTGWAVKPQVGFVFKPEPSLALEFWVERGTVFAPDMFTRRVTFIHPALGFTWHH